MARKKQREQYAAGSVSAVMVPKLGRDGSPVVHDGKPAKTQQRDKAGREVWRVCVTRGHEDYFDAHGRRRKRQLKVQKVFHGTLAEARAYRDALAAQYENVDMTSARQTFEWASSRWVQYAKDKNIAAPETIKQYESRLALVSAYIGDTTLAELSADDIDFAVSAVMKARNLSNTTGRKVFAIVKRVLAFCVDRGWLARNPASSTIAPLADEVDPTSRKSLTAEEAARLRSTLDTDIETALAEYAAKESRQASWGNTFGRSAVRGLGAVSKLVCVRLLLASGCRRGEILGLTWDAVDFDAGEIVIRQTLTASMKVKRPKTKSGLRAISIDESTMSLLGWWKEQQSTMLHFVMREDKDGLPHALTQTPQTPVCVSDIGGWLDPNHVGRWWRSYRASIGFDTLLLHELRHTSASLLLGSGYDLMTLAHRLGHKKATLTLAEYGHMMKTNDRKAADLLGSILDAPAKDAGEVVRLERKTA